MLRKQLADRARDCHVPFTELSELGRAPRLRTLLTPVELYLEKHWNQHVLLD